MLTLTSIFLGILEDSFGTLWLGTNAGISNFDPETEIFRNYGLDEGLIDLEFNQSAFAKGKDRIIYFGSTRGVTSFLPEQFHINLEVEHENLKSTQSQLISQEKLASLGQLTAGIALDSVKIHGGNVVVQSQPKKTVF